MWIGDAGDAAEAQSSQTTHQVTPATFSTYFDIDSSTEVATLKDAYKSDTTLVFGAGEYRNAMHIQDATNVVLRASNAPDSTSAATLRPRRIVENLDSTQRRHAVFAVTASTNVTIDRFNFAFDCVYDRTGGQGALAVWGIFFEDSSGVISNNLLLDILDETRGVQNPRRHEDACGGTIGTSKGAGIFRMIRVQTSASYVPDIDDAGMVTNRLPIHITGNQINNGIAIGIHISGYLNATVSENVISDTANNAINMVGASSGVLSNNKLTNIGSAAIAYYPNWFVPNSPDGETIEANLEIRENDIGQSRFFDIALGVGWCASQDGTTVNTNAKIIGNHMHDGAHGIQINSCAGNEDERIKADIIGNTMEGTSSSFGIFAATSFNSGTSATAWFEVNAKYNVISGYGIGIRITNQNAGNTYGVNRARVHATHNYWGTNTETPRPLIHDVIQMPDVAGITYEPWLHDTKLAGRNGVYGKGERQLSDFSEGPNVVLASILVLNEARTSTFDVKLDAQPARDTRVTVGSDNPDLSFSPSSVTFTPDNWDTPQTVTVTVARDGDVEDEQTLVWGISDDGVLAGGFKVIANTRVNDAKIQAHHFINKLEPTISKFTTGGGETVRLGIVPYGRQDIVDNDLIDGKTDVVWSVEGGSGGEFREADASLDSDNDPDDRVILFTSPETPGTYTVHATLASCGIDTSVDCRATFTVNVRRGAPAILEPTVAPMNPNGAIPAVLVDSDGGQYEVFTPVSGGRFEGEGYSILAGSSAVPNGEIIGIRMAEAGAASNVGMTTQRYTLGGSRYEVLAVDAAGSAIASYALKVPAEVCVPLPAELRGNIRDIALVAVNSDASLTILSARVKIGGPSLQVCANLSALPAAVAVGTAGAPAAIPTPEPQATPEPPATGGYAPGFGAGWSMLLIFIVGLVTVVLGLGVALSRRGAV